VRQAILGAVIAVASLVGPVTAPAHAAESVSESLKHSLKDAKPEARVSAVEEVARTAGAAPADERRRVALILRKTLEADPAPTVRVAAVHALSRLDDEAAWVPVLVAAISSRDDAVRAAAVEAVLTAKSDVVPVARKLLHEDSDPTFRAETALLLGRRRRLDAAPALLDALADLHPRVSTAAAEALEAISGEAHGWDPVAWKAWWERVRAPAAPVPAMGDTVTREVGPPTVPPPPPPAKGLIPDLYGIPLRAKDLVFVIDTSGSIGAEGFETAKGELVRATERLASDVRFAALFFDETVRLWHPEMVLATPEAKADLARFVRGIPRGKRTDVMTPLNAGLQILRKRTEARRAAGEAATEPVTMIVVSDGQENLRSTPGDFVGDKLDQLDLAHCVVHAIVVGGKDNALMFALAKRAGGIYRVVP
jgi:HEAT repeat protein